MEIEDSKDGILSKDWNIDNMLNNSRTNFGWSSRRKKSLWTTEGAQMLRKISALNKTHDYHNSTANLHNQTLNPFGFDEVKICLKTRQKSSVFHNQTDIMNINSTILNNFQQKLGQHRNSRSSQRYANTFDTPEEEKNILEPQNKSIVKYLDTSKFFYFTL